MADDPAPAGRRSWLSPVLVVRSRQRPHRYRSVVSGDLDADGGDDLFWYLSPGDDSIWWHTTQMFGRKAWTNTPFR